MLWRNMSPYVICHDMNYTLFQLLYQISHLQTITSSHIGITISGWAHPIQQELLPLAEIFQWHEIAKDWLGYAELSRKIQEHQTAMDVMINGLTTIDTYA